MIDQGYSSTMYEVLFTLDPSCSDQDIIRSISEILCTVTGCDFPHRRVNSHFHYGTAQQMAGYVFECR